MAKKVVLITGTSSGFGYLAAKTLAEKGYRVYASMRQIEGKNAKSAGELSSASENIHVVDLDVTNQASVDGAIATLLAAEHRLDVLINNAGTLHAGVTEAFSIDQLQKQMDVNYFGVARMFKAVLPQMRKQQSGLIITVTSIAGRLVFPSLHTYNSTKFAAEALGEGYRYELSQFGIDSVLLEPGPFKTSLIGHTVWPEDEQVLQGYGEFANLPKQVLEGFDSFMEENQAGDANPQGVVDDMVRLIETPFGSRPTRTVSGIDYGTREFNKRVSGIQENVLESMGLAHLDPNKNHQPA